MPLNGNTIFSDPINYPYCFCIASFLLFRKHSTRYHLLWMVMLKLMERHFIFLYFCIFRLGSSSSAGERKQYQWACFIAMGWKNSVKACCPGLPTVFDESMAKWWLTDKEVEAKHNEAEYSSDHWSIKKLLGSSCLLLKMLLLSSALLACCHEKKLWNYSGPWWP